MPARPPQGDPTGGLVGMGKLILVLSNKSPTKSWRGGPSTNSSGVGPSVPG